MQEQNKKPTAEEGKDKAHNHSRKRGYFMEPPSAAKKNTSPAESSENNKPQDNKRSDGAHHQKRNHNSFKKRSPEQKNVSQNAENPQASRPSSLQSSSLKLLHKSHRTQMRQNKKRPMLLKRAKIKTATETKAMRTSRRITRKIKKLLPCRRLLKLKRTISP